MFTYLRNLCEETECVFKDVEVINDVTFYAEKLSKLFLLGLLCESDQTLNPVHFLPKRKVE